MFLLSFSDLLRAFQLLGYPHPGKELVFVGIRGCLPVEPLGCAWKPEVRLHAVELDYIHPRCTLLQWDIAEQRIAAYPGSTVPSRLALEKAKRRSGRGANQLVEGYYSDYRRGWHRAGAPTGHLGWRQTAPRPIQRTSDDAEIDEHDPISREIPMDNLHAAWCRSVDGRYSSAGCQVVVGLPHCRQRGALGDSGPWKLFRERGYAAQQERYRYALVGCAKLKSVLGIEGGSRQ
jgi:hypothetical protein